MRRRRSKKLFGRSKSSMNTAATSSVVPGQNNGMTSSTFNGSRPRRRVSTSDISQAAAALVAGEEEEQQQQQHQDSSVDLSTSMHSAATQKGSGGLLSRVSINNRSPQKSSSSEDATPRRSSSDALQLDRMKLDLSRHRRRPRRRWSNDASGSAAATGLSLDGGRHLLLAQNNNGHVHEGNSGGALLDSLHDFGGGGSGSIGKGTNTRTIPDGASSISGNSQASGNSSAASFWSNNNHSADRWEVLSSSRRSSTLTSVQGSEEAGYASDRSTENFAGLFLTQSQVDVRRSSHVSWGLSGFGADGGGGDIDITHTQSSSGGHEDWSCLSPQDLASKIILIRRIFPDCAAKFQFCSTGQDGKPSEPAWKRKECPFHLSGGYIRRQRPVEICEAPPFLHQQHQKHQQLNQQQNMLTMSPPGFRRRSSLQEPSVNVFRRASLLLEQDDGSSFSSDDEEEDDGASDNDNDDCDDTVPSYLETHTEEKKEHLSFLPPLPPNARKATRKKKKKKNNSINHFQKLNNNINNWSPTSDRTSIKAGRGDVAQQRYYEHTTGDEFLTFFLQWESRKVDDVMAFSDSSLITRTIPSTSTGTDSKLNGQHKQETTSPAQSPPPSLSCSRWHLSLSTPPESTPQTIESALAQISEWNLALKATTALRKSQLWQQTDKQLTALAGMLCVHFCLGPGAACTTPEPIVGRVVPPDTLLQFLGLKFQLIHSSSRVFAMELVHALVDAELLIPYKRRRRRGSLGTGIGIGTTAAESLFGGATSSSPAYKSNSSVGGFYFSESLVRLYRVLGVSHFVNNTNAAAPTTTTTHALALTGGSFGSIGTMTPNNHLHHHGTGFDNCGKSALTDDCNGSLGTFELDDAGRMTSFSDLNDDLNEDPHLPPRVLVDMANAASYQPQPSLYFDALQTQETYLPPIRSIHFSDRQKPKTADMQPVKSDENVVQELWRCCKSKDNENISGWKKRRELWRSFDKLHLRKHTTATDIPPPRMGVTREEEPTNKANVQAEEERVNHSFPCPISISLIPQPVDIWPQRPMLLRPSPGSGMIIHGIRHSSSEKTLFLPGSGFCCGCTLPINSGQEGRGKALVMDFETSLFVGTALIRVRNVKDAIALPPGSMSSEINPDPFEGKKRTFQAVIRGQFRTDDVIMADCVTGQDFSQPWGEVQPRWMLRSAVNLLSVVSPDHVPDFVTDQPRLVTPLLSSVENVLCKRIRRIDVQRGRYRSGGSIEAPVVEGSGSRSLMAPTSRSALADEANPALRRQYRKNFFRNHGRSKSYGQATATTTTTTTTTTTPTTTTTTTSYTSPNSRNNDEKMTFRKDRIYTFEFHHHFFDFATMSVDAGLLGKYPLAGMLRGQPLKFMAARTSTNNATGGSITRQGNVGVCGAVDDGGGFGRERGLEYLWSFDLCHENMFQGDNASVSHA